MDVIIITLLPLFLAWMLDLIFGDPARLPHLIVYFGKAIAYFEHRLNKGKHRVAKGACVAIGLIILSFFLTWGLLDLITPWPWLTVIVKTALIFYCLAGTTLIREVRMVFLALDKSIEAGRRQVARIVGRDTAQLSEDEIRTAALETLSENLSDGVVAPLFWFALLGVPGMVAYKMVNTLDSMIGYRNKRYKDFGCVAAHIDDIANYIPARLTAFLMVIAAGKPGLLSFVRRFGRQHASPNSGYPEAALAGILDCRFGGPHDYFGETVDKPYIGTTDRPLTTTDMRTAVRINRIAETLAILTAGLARLLMI
ncbi:adenosylcobinamide-phosphate synthase CbiB [uncultured Duncaniella sp.]|uniref:adenosylcobinamide-phosphate synthase CbiB n=1 Tax=uncultured Duncaniella sp. TaxID=2768039 RepID=UPI00260682D7|nr:adenosylcobinamide-phosphate synthase CbiB [uncultured Duncaniella sp.]